MLQSAVLHAVEVMIAKGYNPPVRISGNVDKVDPAMIWSKGVLMGSCRLRSATVTVIISGLCNRTKGHKKLFHEFMKKMIPRLAIAGLAMGMMILKNIRNSEQP